MALTCTKRRRRTKRALMRRDGFNCYYCKRLLNFRRTPDPSRPLPDTSTFDHIIPRSQGGSDKLDNLVLACDDCNKRRSAMPAVEFLQLIHDERSI